ncbi:MAG: hypothetical protein ACT4OM_09905 [Actinomycetota bacterium]
MRTHGVSGSPPEVLVNDPNPAFLSGDGKAGFYRRLAPPESGPGRNIEAYSWSAISSRSKTRAFWILLFPFAMVNHAGWMVGPKPGGGWERALIRLIGVALTIHYALWAMVVFVDLLAYQCGGSAICRGRYLLGWFDSTLSFLGPSPLRHAALFSVFPVIVILALLWTGRGDPADYERWPGRPDIDQRVDGTLFQDPAFWQSPSTTRLMASSHGLAALAAVGATLAGAVQHLAGGAAPLRATLWVLCGLASALVLAAGWVRHKPRDALLWGRAVTLVGVLTLSAIAVVVWQAFVAPAPEAAQLPAVLPALRAAFDGILLVEFGLLMLYFLKDQPRMFLAIALIGSTLYLTLSRPAAEQRSALGLLPGPAEARWLVAATLLAVAGVGVYGLRNRAIGSKVMRGDKPPENPDRHLSNQFWIFFGLAPVFLASLAAVRAAEGAGARTWAGIAGAVICSGYLMAMARVQISRAHDYAPRWKLRVGGPATLAAVGATGLTLVSAAVIVFAAQRLGHAAPAGRPTGIFNPRQIRYYEELGWIAAAGLGSLIVFGLAFRTRTAALWRYRYRAEVSRIDAALGKIQSMPPRLRRKLPVKMAKARASSCLIDDLDWMVTTGIVAFLACCLSVVAGQVAGNSSVELDRFVGFASWLLVSVAFLVIWVVRTAQRESGIRRAIGTLWEVTGFFPRRFHPLAPPSYGDRAVPELRARLIELTQGEGRVLLLAHSQGTLLCNAVLQSVLGSSERSRLERIKLVTYGCMLQRSYGRSFPSVVRVPDLIELKAALEGVNGEQADFPSPAAPPGWMNFGRTTDYLGGRMFVDPHRPPNCRPEQDRPDDVFLDDPPVPERAVEAGKLHLWGHSFNYLHPGEDRRFREHVLETLQSMSRVP